MPFTHIFWDIIPVYNECQLFYAAFGGSFIFKLASYTGSETAANLKCQGIRFIKRNFILLNGQMTGPIQALATGRPNSPQGYNKVLRQPSGVFS